MSLRRNVLIFHSGALGDFILTWPLAMALSRLFPQSRIIYVTHSQKGELAERVLRVEWSDVEHGWHQLFSAEPELPEPALARLRCAHCVVSFVSTAADTWTTNVRSMAGAEAQVVCLDPRPPVRYAHHATDFLVEQLQSAPAIKSALEQMLRAVEQRGAVSRKPPEHVVVIHPGSGSATKNWPRANFIELVSRLRGSARRVRALFGEVEAEKWSDAQVAEFQRVADEVVRPARLTELLESTVGASVLLANDSGPAHLAGIVGVPTVTLFGPSDPTIWRPIGPSVRIIRAEPIDAITVDRVYDELINLPGV